MSPGPPGPQGDHCRSPHLTLQGDSKAVRHLSPKALSTASAGVVIYSTVEDLRQPDVIERKAQKRSEKLQLQKNTLSLQLYHLPLHGQDKPRSTISLCFSQLLFPSPIHHKTAQVLPLLRCPWYVCGACYGLYYIIRIYQYKRVLAILLKIQHS